MTWHDGAARSVVPLRLRGDWNFQLPYLYTGTHAKTHTKTHAMHTLCTRYAHAMHSPLWGLQVHASSNSVIHRLVHVVASNGEINDTLICVVYPDRLWNTDKMHCQSFIPILIMFDKFPDSEMALIVICIPVRSKQSHSRTYLLRLAARLQAHIQATSRVRIGPLTLKYMTRYQGYPGMQWVQWNRAYDSMNTYTHAANTTQ